MFVCVFACVCVCVCVCVSGAKVVGVGAGGCNYTTFDLLKGHHLSALVIGH